MNTFKFVFENGKSKVPQGRSPQPFFEYTLCGSGLAKFAIRRVWMAEGSLGKATDTTRFENENTGSGDIRHGKSVSDAFLIGSGDF